MKNFLLGVLVAAIIYVSLGTVHAQSPQAFAMTAAAPIATCPALPVTTTTLCQGTDDIVVAWPGDKAYTSLKALKTGGSVTLTLQGVTKTLPATFSLSAASGTTVVSAQ